MALYPEYHVTDSGNGLSSSRTNNFVMEEAVETIAKPEDRDIMIVVFFFLTRRKS